MRKFGLAIVAVVILISGVNVARAQDSVSPESASLVKELVEVTGGKQTFNDIVSGTMSFQNAQTRQMLNDLFKDDSDSTRADKAMFSKMTEEVIARIETRSKEFFTKRFDFDKFVNDVFVPVYTKHYTDNELRDMIAFFRTPTGQKMTKEMPELMLDSMVAISKNLMPAFNEYMKQVLDDEIATIKQKLSKKKAPPRS